MAFLNDFTAINLITIGDKAMKVHAFRVILAVIWHLIVNGAPDSALEAFSLWAIAFRVWKQQRSPTARRDRRRRTR